MKDFMKDLFEDKFRYIIYRAGLILSIALLVIGCFTGSQGLLVVSGLAMITLLYIQWEVIEQLFAGHIAKEDILEDQEEEIKNIKDRLYEIYRTVAGNYTNINNIMTDICNRYSISSEDKKEIFNSLNELNIITKDIDEED